jgi:hypothetical protein
MVFVVGAPFMLLGLSRGRGEAPGSVYGFGTTYVDRTGESSSLYHPLPEDKRVFASERKPSIFMGSPQRQERSPWERQENVNHSVKSWKHPLSVYHQASKYIFKFHPTINCRVRKRIIVPAPP